MLGMGEEIEGKNTRPSAVHLRLTSTLKRAVPFFYSYVSSVSSTVAARSIQMYLVYTIRIPSLSFRSNARPALAQPNYRRLDGPPTRFAADPAAHKYKPEPKPKPKKKLSMALAPATAAVPLRIVLPSRMNGAPTFLAHFQYPFLYRPL
jgi:hypothetical protein